VGDETFLESAHKNTLKHPTLH